jgi:gliding motility-associated-like protein
MLHIVLRNWLLLVFINAGPLWGQNLIKNPFLNPDVYCLAIQDIFSFGHELHITPCRPYSWGSPWTFDSSDVPRPIVGEGVFGMTPRYGGCCQLRYMQSPKLIQSLDSGQTYVVEFWYRPWKRCYFFPVHIGATIASRDDIGNNYEYWANVSPPDVELNTPITDTANWHLFKQSFVARADTSRLLNIGGFHPESEMTIPNGPVPLSGNPLLNNFVNPIIWICGPQLYKATDTIFSISLPKDTILCNGESLVLRPTNDGGFKLLDTLDTYLWSTGSTDSSITVSSPGTYWVEYTINNRFKSRDYIVVEYASPPQSLGLPDTFNICEGQSGILSANTIDKSAYLWSNGDTTSATVASRTGYYRLSVSNRCYTVKDSTWVSMIPCNRPFWIPNTFSPNGDGENDFFRFENVPEPITLLVFNRWGQLVYQSEDYQNDWDGTDINGNALPEGVYTYKIQYRYFAIPNPPPGLPGALKEVLGQFRIIQ